MDASFSEPRPHRRGSGAGAGAARVEAQLLSQLPELLKEKLAVAQNRMKQQHDKHKREMEYVVGVGST